ncbi:SCAN domain-containing protein 3-like, partial [Tachysurus ichikawai]
MRQNKGFEQTYPLKSEDSVPETAFPGLRTVALYILTMFGSTYNCEADFSTMNIIQTKYGSRVTNEQLHVYESGPDSIQAQNTGLAYTKEFVRKSPAQPEPHRGKQTRKASINGHVSCRVTSQLQ